MKHTTGLGIHGSGLIEEAGIVVVTNWDPFQSFGSSVAGFWTPHSSTLAQARSWMFSTGIHLLLPQRRYKQSSCCPNNFSSKTCRECRRFGRSSYHGVDIGDAEAHVVPVFVKTPQRAIQIASSLLRDGFFCTCYSPSKCSHRIKSPRASLSIYILRYY